MAEEDDPQWMRFLKESGTVAFRTMEDVDGCCWSAPPGDCFKVRGPSYFSDRIKVPAGDWILRPLAFDWLKGGPSKLQSLLAKPSNRIASAVAAATGEARPFVWAFNLQVPSKENHSAVLYFVDQDRQRLPELVQRFLDGDDAYKNSRLKLIANIVQGPWIVKAAVGEQAVCVLGRSLTCKYSAGDNFLEVDVDIGSSMVANAIVHLAIGYISSLTVDLAFLVESQEPQELPEQVLGAVRLANLDLQSARTVEEEPEEQRTSENPGSFGSRLWNFWS